jgi:hypothetical protein
LQDTFCLVETQLDPDAVKSNMGGVGPVLESGVVVPGPVAVGAKEFVCVSLSEGRSSFVVGNASADLEPPEGNDAVSIGSTSVEPLVSMHGPDEHMRGMVLDRGLRDDIASQEDAALGKMRRFCAAILKKLAPPLLKEIESSTLIRHDEGLVTPRRVTRANAGVPACGTAPRRSKKASVAEAVLLEALGITQSDLEVNKEAIEEFRTLFDSPVRDQHLRAMAAIFGKTVPSSFVAPDSGPGGVLVQ